MIQDCNSNEMENQISPSTDFEQNRSIQIIGFYVKLFTFNQKGSVSVLRVN